MSEGSPNDANSPAKQGEEVEHGEEYQDTASSEYPPSSFGAMAAYYEQHIGPLPPPETLERYEQAMSGLQERIVDRMEEESDHRHSMEKRGQIIAAILEGGGATRWRGSCIRRA